MSLDEMRKKKNPYVVMPFIYPINQALSFLFESNVPNYWRILHIPFRLNCTIDN